MIQFPFFILPDMYNDSYENDIHSFILRNKDMIFDKLHNIGAVLFRGFNLTTSQDFENSIKLLSPSLKNYIGGDSPRDKIRGGVYTSTRYPPETSISMHHEKSYSNNYPSYIYFFCEIAPIYGGETPILDSRLLYRNLDKKIIDKFFHKKLKYIMNLHSGNGFGKSWQEAFELDNKEELENLLKELKIQYFWKPNGLLQLEEIVSPIIKHPITKESVFFSQADQWHPSNLGDEILSDMLQIMPREDFYHNCCYGDDTEIDNDDLNYIRSIIRKERVMFKWERGDLLMLDNILTMHGRLPFKGERRILVAMS